MGWGLWHKGQLRWLNWPMSTERREYGSRREAEAAKVQITKGRRDVLTNYFRIAVAVRQFKKPK